METCELNVIKYTLYLFNFVFAISGIGLIVAGALTLGDISEFSHFLEGRILAPPVVLIVAGIIIFVVAFLGCYGAVKELYTMLIAFALCLVIILVIELAVGIAAAVYRSDFEMVLKDVFRQSLDHYQDTKADMLAWNHIQTKLECCGMEGPNDWPENQRPMTCCHDVRKNAKPPENFHCQQATLNSDILYTEGCFQKLQNKVDSNAKVLIGVGIGIAFLQVVGIILACWLAALVKRKQ